MASTRKKNFSVDEVRVLREKFAENKTYLQSPFNNKVTNEGKDMIWEEIASSINASGHEIRTVNEVKHKWNNLVSAAKSTYHEHNKYRNGTGGGPPKKEHTEETMKTIDLLKDDTSFRGLNGIETFVSPISEQHENILSDDSTEVVRVEDKITVTPIRVDTNSDSRKRPHHQRTPQQDDSDIKQKLLKQEQYIQEMKLENLQLEKTKLQLEIELLQRKFFRFANENQGEPSASGTSSTSGSWLNFLTDNS